MGEDSLKQDPKDTKHKRLIGLSLKLTISVYQNHHKENENAQRVRIFKTNIIK